MTGMRMPTYPPPGAIVVTRTTLLHGDFPMRGFRLHRRRYTHVTIALPGAFESEDEAREFAALLGDGCSVERAG